MGVGGIGAALFAELVSRVSGGEIAASAVGRCRPGVARTIREAFSSSLIAGARQVLARLGRAHHLGLVTSGDRDRVTQQLREFRLTQLFGARVCSGDTPEKKPHPAPLRLALQKLCLKPSACVYVGDSPEDLEMAKRAGVRAIAVLGPFPTEKRLRAARPDFLLESIRELPELLKRLHG